MEKEGEGEGVCKSDWKDGGEKGKAEIQRARG